MVDLEIEIEKIKKWNRYGNRDRDKIEVEMDREIEQERQIEVGEKMVNVEVETQM